MVIGTNFGCIQEKFIQYVMSDTSTKCLVLDKGKCTQEGWKTKCVRNNVLQFDVSTISALAIRY